VTPKKSHRDANLVLENLEHAEKAFFAAGAEPPALKLADRDGIRAERAAP
jgi:hypothetical protein